MSVERRLDDKHKEEEDQQLLGCHFDQTGFCRHSANKKTDKEKSVRHQLPGYSYRLLPVISGNNRNHMCLKPFLSIPVHYDR